MNHYAERLARLESLARTRASLDALPHVLALVGLSANTPPLVVLRRRAGHPENALLAEAARALYVRDYGHAPPGPTMPAGVLYLDLEPDNTITEQDASQ